MAKPRYWRERAAQEHHDRLACLTPSAIARVAWQLDEMADLLRDFYPPDPADRPSQAGRISPYRAVVYRAVASAIRAGDLIQPEACSLCGLASKIHAHHADYGRPLDVTWLCASCHLCGHA